MCLYFQPCQLYVSKARAYPQILDQRKTLWLILYQKKFYNLRHKQGSLRKLEAGILCAEKDRKYENDIFSFLLLCKMYITYVDFECALHWIFYFMY